VRADLTKRINSKTWPARVSPGAAAWTFSSTAGFGRLRWLEELDPEDVEAQIALACCPLLLTRARCCHR
jgi:hypothetical protein